MRKHRLNAGPSESLDLERHHLKGKVAHRRRRRRKLEMKTRRLGAWECASD